MMVSDGSIAFFFECSSLWRAIISEACGKHGGAGDFGVTLSAMGGAISTVPQWSQQACRLSQFIVCIILALSSREGCSMQMAYRVHNTLHEWTPARADACRMPPLPSASYRNESFAV